jgi:hypothetical protein
MILQENMALANFSWLRSARTAEREKLMGEFPKLETVGDDLSKRLGWRDGICYPDSLDDM